MTRLGFWQLQRAEEKQHRLDYIQQQNQGTDLTLEEIFKMGNVQDMPISFSGELMREHALFWDNRVVNGAVGYEVIVPVKTSQGLLLANWGWVKGSPDRSRLPSVRFPSHPVQFSGVVWTPSNNPFIASEPLNAGWPKVIQQLDLNALQAYFSLSILPFSVALKNTETHGFVNNHRPVVMPPEKHIAYAIQWFGLALACGVIFVVASFKRGKS